ncbi:L,D-transpeptidase family protein [Haloferula chungangensis]|uniref:L,D-transpeptidase family protein n=1 Tax=Haloferula chungangensis TaxID=1048331 RepID=A0ABW2LC86_9BACT
MAIFRNLTIAAALLLPALAEDRQRNPDSYTWNPELSKEGPVLVTVSLQKQVAAVYRNGVRIGSCEVSSGKPGHETPTGVFHILNKDANHHSKTYGNAPMPYSERLTWDGVALHAGGLPGFPSSHGCIHIPYEFSKQLFGITHTGTTVLVTNDSPDVHVSNEHSMAFQGGESSDFSWTPEASPSGPVSLIYSKPDQKLFVVRNGITIGEGKADSGWFSKRPKGTQAFVFSGWKSDGSSSWTQVGGVKKDHAKALDEWFKLDPRFQHLLMGLLQPGTNLVVTAESVTQQTSSKPGFRVLQGVKEEQVE